jgi:hypothetical protein
MRVVHQRQVIVVGTVRRPIDAVNLQILELILKVPGSSMSRRVLEQVSGHPFDTVWRPQLRFRTAKWRLLSSTPVPPIKYEQNTVFFSEVSNNDLPQSPDRESCPWPHLKQKQWSGYAIGRLQTWPREVEVQAKEYRLPLDISVPRYVEHVLKKCQIHRRHRVCAVVREHHGPERIQVKWSCVP